MNSTIYPHDLLSDHGKHLDEHGPAFGLVQLPKLVVPADAQTMAAAADMSATALSRCTQMSLAEGKS